MVIKKLDTLFIISHQEIDTIFLGSNWVAYGKFIYGFLHWDRLNKMLCVGKLQRKISCSVSHLCVRVC